MRRITVQDVLSGIHVPYLRHLCDHDFAGEGGTVRLAAGVYDLGTGEGLELKTKGLRLLGDEEKKEEMLAHPPMVRGEGAVFTRDGHDYVVRTEAEDVVVEQVSVRGSAENDVHAMGVMVGSATVTGCDLRGMVLVMQGAKLLLNDSFVHNCNQSAVTVGGTATIRGCTIQDAGNGGIWVRHPGRRERRNLGAAHRRGHGLAPSPLASGSASTPGSTRAARAR